MKNKKGNFGHTLCFCFFYSSFTAAAHGVGTLLGHRRRLVQSAHSSCGQSAPNHAGAENASASVHFSGRRQQYL